MLADFQSLQNVRNGMAVKRFHTTPTIQQNTVAQHSLGCAALLYLIYDDPSPAVVKAAIHHDFFEYYTGDIPSPAKRSGLVRVTGLPENPCAELSEVERRQLKFVDCFEGMLFCCEERLLGNRNLIGVFNTYLNYIEALNLDQVERGWVILITSKYYGFPE